MRNLAKPGDLDQRVALYHRTLTEDGMGGSTQTLTLYATVWGKVTPKTGEERAASMRTEEQITYDVIIRNRTDMEPTDVIGWEGRQLAVKAILTGGSRPLYLQLECDMGARL